MSDTTQPDHQVDISDVLESICDVQEIERAHRVAKEEHSGEHSWDYSDRWGDRVREARRRAEKNLNAYIDQQVRLALKGATP